jgi:hypothetical protein
MANLPSLTAMTLRVFSPFRTDRMVSPSLTASRLIPHGYGQTMASILNDWRATTSHFERHACSSALEIVSARVRTVHDRHARCETIGPLLCPPSSSLCVRLWFRTLALIACMLMASLLLSVSYQWSSGSGKSSCSRCDPFGFPPTRMNSTTASQLPLEAGSGGLPRSSLRVIRVIWRVPQ